MSRGTTSTYDKDHNRTHQSISGGSGPGSTTLYEIGNGSNGAGANQLISATTGDDTVYYNYDANGNPPPPPPPPPPFQHAPPLKQTGQPPPPPPHPPGPPGIDPGVTGKPVSSTPAASAKTTDPAKSGESNKVNTEAAGHVLDVSGAATEIGEASSIKVGVTYLTGQLSTYTSAAARGSGSYGILADVSKVSGALNKGLGPIGFGVGLVSDAAALKSGQESRTIAAVNTAINAAAWRIAAMAVSVGGWRVGQTIGHAIDSIPMAGGRTVGENLELGILRVIAPSAVQTR